MFPSHRPVYFFIGCGERGGFSSAFRSFSLSGAGFLGARFLSGLPLFASVFLFHILFSFVNRKKCSVSIYAS